MVAALSRKPRGVRGGEFADLGFKSSLQIDLEDMVSGL